MSRVERRLLRWFQRRCQHPGSEVIADLMQRDILPYLVSWCGTCGAFAVNRESEAGHVEQWTPMRRPEPTWISR